MKLLYDLFPLMVFFGAYKFRGIFVATAVAIVASVIQIGAYAWRYRKVEVVHAVALAVIVVFGGLTLWLQDSAYIKLVPTIAKWILAAILLGSQVVGKKTAIEYLLGAQIELPRPVWRRLNVGWALFFIVLGAANIYVAFFYRLQLDAAEREAIWVDFKVWGVLALTALFIVAQSLYLARHLPQSAGKEKKST